MKHVDIENLIHRIVSTEDDEIDCNQLSELLAQYVDSEVLGGDAARLYPVVRQHLNQCDDCAEFHEMLFEIALLESQNRLPVVEDLLEGILDDGRLSHADSSLNSEKSPILRILPNAKKKADESGTGVSSTVPTEIVEVQGSTSIFGKIAWSWIAAAAIVLVALTGVWGWQLSSQLADVRSSMAFVSGADRAIPMRGTELDPDAMGVLLIDDDKAQGLLVIRAINPLPSSRVYQLWVGEEMTDAVSAGTFDLGSSDSGSAWVSFDEAPEQFVSLAITSEPIGGSHSPTSSPVCVRGQQVP